MIVAVIPFISKEMQNDFEKAIGEKIYFYKKSDEAMEVLPEAEILINFGMMRKDIADKCRKLKWLFSLSAGVDKLPFEKLMEMGVKVTNTRGIHGSQMSEHIMGIIICFSRQLNRCMRDQLERKWEQNLTVDELTGKNLCIIGAGSIGRETARKAKVFNMYVTGLKKHPEKLENFNAVWGIERLHEALGLADYTVLITPLTDETYHLIGREEFKAMKRSGFFINVSRGDTVDESAMIEALQNGIIQGAGLDVFHKEPLPQDSPLWNMKNVIITPHNAGVSPFYMEKSFKIFLQSLVLYRQGKPLPNQIDLKRKY